LVTARAINTSVVTASHLIVSILFASLYLKNVDFIFNYRKLVSLYSNNFRYFLNKAIRSLDLALRIFYTLGEFNKLLSRQTAVKYLVGRLCPERRF
jgi:hypothetical protein